MMEGEEVKFVRANGNFEVEATVYPWAKRNYLVEFHAVLCRRVGIRRIVLQESQSDSPMLAPEAVIRMMDEHLAKNLTVHGLERTESLGDVLLGKSLRLRFQADRML